MTIDSPCVGGAWLASQLWVRGEGAFCGCGTPVAPDQSGRVIGFGEPAVVVRRKSWLARSDVRLLVAVSIVAGMLAAFPAHSRASSQTLEWHLTNSSDTDLVFDSGSGKSVGCTTAFQTLDPPSTIAAGSSAIFQVQQCGDPFTYTFAFHLAEYPDQQVLATAAVNGSSLDMNIGPPTPSGYIMKNDPTYNASNDPGPPTFVDSEIFDCNSRTCDGIADDWKLHGYTDPGTGQFVDLPHMGADVNKPDIFLQIDWMADSTINHKLDPTGIKNVVDAFRNSPYKSRTGSVGINLHVDEGSDSILDYATNTTWGSLSRARQLPEVAILGTYDTVYHWDAFDAIKNASGGFASTGRAPIFHYVISANNHADSDPTSSGIARGAEKGGSDLIVSLGSFDVGSPYSGVGTPLQQSATLMHELGHNLGLAHGGSDSINGKPNYLSVMNYLFDKSGLTENGTSGILDYSRTPISLNETSLDENTGLGSAAGTYSTKHFCPAAPGRSAGAVWVRANGPIDWNCDPQGTIEKDPQSFNVNSNFDSTIDPNDSGYDDWSNLKLVRGAIGSGSGASVALPTTSAGEPDTPAVQAADDAIIATAAPLSPTEGRSIVGSLATFNDGDPAASAGEFAATIDWGDGVSSDTGSISGPTGGPFTVAGSHTYAEEGTYSVSVSVVHTAQADNTAVTTGGVVVGDAPLSATGMTLYSTNPFAGAVATLIDSDSNGTAADYTTATIDWGDGGPTSAGIVSANGSGFVVSGTHAYAALGPYTVSTHICDTGGSCADATTKLWMFGYSSGGSFVVGDAGVGSVSGATGKIVTFWGSQWAKTNRLSGGPAPSGFKGLEDNPARPGCGTSWTTNPGNSAAPPSTIPTYMAVIVSSTIAGAPNDAITGNDVHVVIVMTNAGYGPQPSTPGTGTIVAVIC